MIILNDVLIIQHFLLFFNQQFVIFRYNSWQQSISHCAHTITLNKYTISITFHKYQLPAYFQVIRYYLQRFQIIGSKYLNNS
jgi:hypothetical protein